MSKIKADKEILKKQKITDLSEIDNDIFKKISTKTNI